MNDPTIMKKKVEDYGANINNFSIDGELTVTITLNEYRSLVSDVATKQSGIDLANKDKYAREAENKALKEANAALKMELYDLRKRLEDESKTTE